MQLQGPSADQVPPLPSAPLLEVWLFEQPTALAVAAAVIGLAVGVGLIGRGKRPVGLLVLLIGVVLAAGLVLTGRLIETPRETIKQRSADLAVATASGDGPAASDILDDGVSIRQPDFRFPANIERRGRDAVVAEIEALADLRAVATIQVLETRASVESPRVGRTHIRVRALNNDGGWLGHSWWKIDWVKRGDAWLAAEITPLWIQFN